MSVKLGTYSETQTDQGYNIDSSKNGDAKIDSLKYGETLFVICVRRSFSIEALGAVHLIPIHNFAHRSHLLSDIKDILLPCAGEALTYDRWF